MYIYLTYIVLSGVRRYELYSQLLPVTLTTKYVSLVMTTQLVIIKRTCELLRNLLVKSFVTFDNAVNSRR